MGFLNKLSNKITNKIENNVFRSAEKGVDKAMDSNSYKKDATSGGNDCPKCGYMSTDRFCPKCGAEMRPEYSNPSDTTESNPFGSDASSYNSSGAASSDSGSSFAAFGIPDVDFSNLTPELRAQVEEALRTLEKEIPKMDPAAQAQARKIADEIRLKLYPSQVF
jgi:hypothetical protein